MSELRGLGTIQQELAQRKGGIVAVSVDSPKLSAKVIKQNKLAFPIVADEDRAITKKYGLFHPHGSPYHDDIPIPAHFLIDKEGKIVWRHVAATIQDRPDAETELQTIDKFFPK